MWLTINNSALLHSKALVNDPVGSNTWSRVTQAVNNPVQGFTQAREVNFTN